MDEGNTYKIIRNLVRPLGQVAVVRHTSNIHLDGYVVSIYAMIIRLCNNQVSIEIRQHISKKKGDLDLKFRGRALSELFNVTLLFFE